MNKRRRHKAKARRQRNAERVLFRVLFRVRAGEGFSYLLKHPPAECMDPHPSRTLANLIDRAALDVYLEMVARG